MIKEKLINRLGQLKTERSSWDGHIREIYQYLLPRSGRFFTSDRNNGTKKHNSILDSAGTKALRVLGAGMMAGATSPARPWFKLGTSDPELSRSHDVKVWLDDVTQLIQRVFQKSNTYRALHSIYEELAVPGTGASIVVPDFQNVIHHYVQTFGEFYIATDFKGNVCTLFREFERPVSEIVKEFGYDQCSITVQHLYNSGTLDAWVPIVHVIEPRADRDISKKDNLNMPWASYYFELGNDKEKILRESGFREFPCLCPRWSVAGGDIYGTSPAMDCLGDVKQLQVEHLHKAQGINYMVDPPIVVPVNLKNRDIERLPGGVSYADLGSNQQKVQSLFDVNIKLDHLLLDIQDVRERIRSSFYADLFLMLANATDTRMTATEVAERHEEKLLMLGPVLERLHNELLSPLIDITFSTLLRAGALPPPPEEMNGVEINVEFISMLAQAQRAIGANAIDRYVGNLVAVANIKPDVLDKFNADEWAERYADMLGVDPNLINANENVAIIRRQREEMQAQAQQAMVAEQQSKAIKNLAQSPTGQDSALDGVVSMFSGYR